MPHDSTPLDNWYHEMVNHLAIAGNYTHIAIIDFERGEQGTETVIGLKKIVVHHNKLLAMLREDYIERKRLEKP